MQVPAVEMMGGPGELDIYVLGDDDAESEYLRIFVTNNGVTTWIDLTPKRMAILRDAITETLLAAGCCKHGEHGMENERFQDFCMECEKEHKRERAGLSS